MVNTYAIGPVKVTGYLFAYREYPAVEFGVRRSLDGQWTVTETQTGRRVNYSAPTRAAAVRESLALLRKHAPSPHALRRVIGKWTQKKK